MEVICRKPVKDGDNIVLKEIDIKDMTVNEKAIMSIDGSTTCSGVCVMNMQGMILYSMAFKRTEGETPVQYKVRWKRSLLDIFTRNRSITNVFYEEPFLGYAEAAKVLMMLRTSVEELIEEESPDLEYLKLIEVSNKKWKSLFLAPEICPVGTENEKKAVRKKLESMLPSMSVVTQDEVDAASMGFVAIWNLQSHKENDLKSRKPAKAFKYNIEFIGADSDEDILEDIGLTIKDRKIPPELVDTMEFYSLPGTGKFEDFVYKAIGEEDKLVVLQFKSGKYGNLALQYNIGGLSKNYEYIYAVCWRKTRRK